MPDLPWVATIPNAIDLSLYPCKPHRGDYLLFLGRFSPDKGAHRAIAVAMELGLPLKLAGKNREPKERQYFAEFVEPHLGHGGIEYLGEVSHGEKVELLQDARATLFPIEWEEPFGLVMVESMACGTPVIATRHGAVPEVIEDGRSGIIVDNYRQMAAALEQADALDPMECRALRRGALRAGADGRRLRAGLRGCFVPVAPEPAVRLPERRGALVVRGLAVLVLEVGAGGFDELVLVHPLPDALAPEPQLSAQAPEVVARLLDDAEVDQREPLGRAQLDLVDRALPGVEVDLGRRRDGPGCGGRA